MRIYLSTCILLFAVALSSGQNNNYTIESFQGDYQELDSFNSYILETGSPFPTWSKEFIFEFSFPYFDTTFNRITCYSSSSCDFGPDIFLDLFSFGYEFDLALDPNNIDSDLRYEHITKDGMDALVLQYTKNRLSSDTTVEEHNSFINFQTWFFENGNIEIHFGESNLDSSNVYVPGEGFYMHFGNHDPVLLGPYVGLTDPSNVNRGIGMEGTYDDYEVDTFGFGLITEVPPEGWVIRFNKKSSTATSHSDKLNISVYPNPTEDLIHIEAQRSIDQLVLYSVDGKIIMNKEEFVNKSLDIRHLSKGIYFLKIWSDEIVVNKRIIKK